MNTSSVYIDILVMIVRKKRVKSAVDGTWRDEGYIVPLKFDTDIDCKWDPYTAANSIFKYLIIEIPN